MPRPETDFPRPHDIARHVIHSTETLEVALNTVGSMIQQGRHFKKGQTLQAGKGCFSQKLHYMRFQLQLLQNLKARSEAVGLRLQNEINLVCSIQLGSLL